LRHPRRNAVETWEKVAGVRTGHRPDAHPDVRWNRGLLGHGCPAGLL